MGGNTLLLGGRFSEFYRYKVRAFPKKNATKIGQFIDRLLTIIFNLCPNSTGGHFTKIFYLNFLIIGVVCISSFPGVRSIGLKSGANFELLKYGALRLYGQTV